MKFFQYKSIFFLFLFSICFDVKSADIEISPDLSSVRESLSFVNAGKKIKKEDVIQNITNKASIVTLVSLMCLFARANKLKTMMKYYQSRKA